MNKTILITGATSGIGRATAKAFIAKGNRIIITGRRQERLDELKAELETEGIEVLALCFDVRYRDEVREHLSNLEAENWSPDILINNAGLAAGADSIENGLAENWNKMIDTNIKGLLYVSEAIIPQMQGREDGFIINIGSIAGKEAYKNGNVYCATKHAVDALTKSMRIDLLPYHIRVSSVCPGAVDTEFSLVRLNGDAEKAKNVYAGYQPLSAEDVAETIHFVATRPKHVCINDVLIMPTAQANTSHILRGE
jgi:3-hydroxy acid dehydrogenase/malonic semialdehyde reductase